MQATSIWAGNEYAFLPNSSRDTRFSLNCFRVRVVRVRKELAFAGAKRSSTKVDVHFLDRDTGETIDFEIPWHHNRVVTKNDDGTYEVKAFDFVEFWEQVDGQYRHLIKKQREREAERERELAERRAEQERRDAARKARLFNIQSFLTDRGIKPEWIQRIDDYNRVVTLDLRLIESSMNEVVPVDTTSTV